MSVLCEIGLLYCTVLHACLSCAAPWSGGAAGPICLMCYLLSML